MNLHISYLLRSLEDPHELDDEQLEQFVQCCPTVLEASTLEVCELLDSMRQHGVLHDPPRETLFDPLLARLVARARQRETPVDPPTQDRIVLLYNELGNKLRCGWRLLQWLATGTGQDELAALVECLVARPPDDSHCAALALTPLFQRRGYDAEILFPRLFAALQHLSVAAPVLDLSNYLTRQGIVTAHPAAGRGGDLAKLLGSLVQQLARVAESPDSLGESPEVVSKKVDECVALVVALCDALALLGDKSAVGKLYQALELEHRRIRTEAAAALARLGEAQGVEQLVLLAAEPVARLRVIAHAEELEVADKIDPQYVTQQAQAEARVALELAQPSFFGIPPASLELIDQRTMFWPGYDQPVGCFLFRYEYRFEEAKYSNIAIAGPLVHAFAADLNDLSPDDIYAAYAGWHVEDESVFEVPLDAPTVAQRAEAEKYERRLRDDDYESIQSVTLGYFFGDRTLVARARRQGVAGIVVVDQAGAQWHPTRAVRHPIGAHEAFCIYKGRRLLRSFND